MSHIFSFSSFLEQTFVIAQPFVGTLDDTTETVGEKIKCLLKRLLPNFNLAIFFWAELFFSETRNILTEGIDPMYMVYQSQFYASVENLFHFKEARIICVTNIKRAD